MTNDTSLHHLRTYLQATIAQMINPIPATMITHAITGAMMLDA